MDLIKFIEGFEKKIKGQFVNKRKNLNVEAEFQIKKKECNLALDIDFFSSRNHIDVGTVFKKSVFSSGNLCLKIEDLFAYSSGTGGVKVSSLQFSSIGFNKTKKGYFRLIIPVKQSRSFRFYIQDTAYTNDLNIVSSSHTQALIGSDLMEAYYFNDKNDNHYFGIESTSKLDYETFADKAFAIKNAIGFLTGIMHGDYGFFFMYNNKNMKEHKEFLFSSFRDTITNIHTPSNSNPYSYIRNAKATVDKLYKNKILRPVSFEEFSRLCEKLFNSGDFTSIIMLMMESGSASLLFRPGGYAIALESLSDLILGDEKLQLAPIKNKPVSQKFRQALNKVVDDFSDRIDEEGVSALKKKIEQINQTTNKARLRAPFEKLGITLLDADLEVLETRNDFLHGRIPDFAKLGIDREDSIKNRDMYYASIRLYTLLSMLILKWIDYDNYVLNYPKIYAKFCQIKLKEPYYRKV